MSTSSEHSPEPRPSGAGDPSLAHRLPSTVRPRRYELLLSPDLDAGTFSGEVLIEADATEAVGAIVLNAAELAVSEARVTGGAPGRPGGAPGGQPGRPGGAPGGDARISLDASAERLTLALPEPLGPGPLDISITFQGTLNDKLRGFYRSTFIDTSGASRTIATTQFEATDARRAFPCFDEPDAKAVFAVTIDVPEGLDAFSNGHVVSEEPLPAGGRRLRFSETIPMSTYLVAFVVGPLVATDPLDVDGTPLRVVHVPGKEDLTSFALEAGAHALRFFTELFGIPYPASKLDLVAIPDFAFGAMENLGCVTFRESALLVDPKRASRLELERVADVISHEIAHMWFGDLVTMRWWHGIWLNEAFATMMELLCVDHFRPEWQRWVSFGTEREVAMATDALHCTRPVEYPVGPPEEAQGMFDVLTYQKGASVLRMLERYLGADAFRDGIRRYLSAHALSNTDTEDLWDAIEDVSGEPVRAVMDTWIRQGGFPLVRVAADPGRKDHLLLSQEPFCYAPPDGDSAIGTAWRVPVIGRVLTHDGPTQQQPAGAGEPDGPGWPARHAEVRMLLGPEPETLETPGGALVLNAWGSGFYRVEYSPDLATELYSRYHELDALERFNLLGDSWAASVAGRASIESFLELATLLAREEDPDVWAQVTGALGFLDHALDGTAREALARFVRRLAGPAFEQAGWEPRRGEPERAATLRAMLLGLLGTVGQDEGVRLECARLHQAAVSGTAALDPDLASPIVATLAACGGISEFETFVDLYRRASTPQEEVRYLYALAGFENPELSERAFDMAMGEVRTQNAPFLVQLLLANRASGPATWHRVKEHFDELLDRFPPNTLPRMLEGVKPLCRDPALVADIRGFLGDHPLPAGQRSVDQTLERLAVNAAFASRLVSGTAEALDAATSVLR